MDCPFETLLGKTLKSIEKRSYVPTHSYIPDPNGDTTELIFTTSEGDRYRLFHEQDCTEYVHLHDLDGDLEDLIGQPLLQAEEVSGESYEAGFCDHCTYTYYKMATRKGSVTLRWPGSSNGYYSEEMSFQKM